ncbi:MAG: hypothetical protein H6824_17845 [Planctomycetaceae bacterium]|nr:hypothetical protein [Planctomycetaceae bacterium]
MTVREKLIEYFDVNGSVRDLDEIWDFNHPSGWNWKRFVPDELVKVWSELSDDAKLIAYQYAECQSDADEVE